MSKYKRRRAKRAQGTPEVSPERVNELVGLTIEAMKTVAFCCCHMPDIGYPCPQHSWGAWEVLWAAKQGKFPKAAFLQDSGRVTINTTTAILGPDVALLGLPWSVGFRNAGARKVRPTVSLMPRRTMGLIKRSGEGVRQQDTLQQLIDLMVECVDEAIKRYPDVYAPVLANPDNVAQMESLGCGYNAMWCHMRPDQ